MIVDSQSLGPEAKQRLAEYQAEHPNFKVVLLSGSDSVDETITAILD